MRKNIHNSVFVSWQVTISLVGMLLVAANVVSAETSISESGLAIVVHKDTGLQKMFHAEVPRGPKVVFSTDMTLDLVVAIPNSISFIRADNVTDGVKVIRIGGKRPGEDGYPLN